MTKIEWVKSPDGTQGKTWNPVHGCTPCSPGCANCYARRMARRLQGRCGYPPAPDYFKVTLRPDRLAQPLQRKKPTMYFVVSMGDLFHEDVPFMDIADIFQTIMLCPQHVFQILTKRPRRMAEYFEFHADFFKESPGTPPNVWLGVTVENQDAADERRADFEATPAAVKFVSYEPALCSVDWTGWEFISQIISGGETGPGARPSNPDWHRATRDFCQTNEIAFFFKQWGEWQPVDQSDTLVQSAQEHVFPDGTISFKMGKKRAGHLLDGREWREMPEVTK